MLTASLLLAVSTLLAGCTSSSGASASDLSALEVASRYGYDASTATLTPVFALVPQYKDPNDGYARDLLAHQCLEGVVDYRAVPPGTDQSLIDERTGQLTFSEQVAAQYGYPQFRMPRTTDSAVPDNVTITAEISQAMSDCGAKADQRLGAPPERTLGDIEAAGWNAIADNEAVEQAAVDWHTCMAPQGVIDLPDDPTEMPPPSVVDPTGTTGGTETDLGELPLTEHERSVAIADAACRAQVGYDTAMFQARVAAELGAIGQNIEGFEASRLGYESYEKKIDEVIAELG